MEGFSNFLWVLLLVPTFWLHLFDPVLTPKVLGALSVLGAFALVQWALRRVTSSLWPGTIAISLLALTPPVVIWSASGLENGIFLLFVAALLAAVLARPRRWQVATGQLAALIAMTRPDGLVFAVAGGMACLMDARAKRDAWPKAFSQLAQYLAAFVGLFGAFVVFPLAVFGLPWPHTYYAKREFLGVEDRLLSIVAKPEAL